MIHLPLSSHCFFLENRSLWASKFHRDLCKHIVKICADFRLAINSPAALDNQISEWVGRHEQGYGFYWKGSVTTVIETAYWGKPALQVYSHSPKRKPALLVAIGFTSPDAA